MMANVFPADRTPNQFSERSRQTFSCRHWRVLSANARHRRAVRGLERTFFLRGPVGHFALWKPPRYFSASTFARLVTAYRDQIGEGVWIFSVVKAPRKFVQVEREILLAHFVIRADDPTFEETPESFDCVCVSGADYVFALAMAHHAMIQILAEQPIAGVLIGRDQLHVLGNGLANETVESRGIGILDYFRDDHSLARDCADDCDLSLCASQSGLLAVLGVHVVCFSADESFVHFYFASQRHHVAFHRGAPPLTDIPSGPVVVAGVLAEHHAMDLQRAHPFLRGQNQIRDLEPDDQRDLGIFKNCVSGDAEVVTVAPTTVGIAAAPAIGLPSNRGDPFLSIAARASHAIGPALGGEEIAA